MIKIICVGKIKEKYLVEAIKEYEKRLQRYARIDVIEVIDICLSDIEKGKKKEAEGISKHIEDKDFVIILDILGEELSSIELSNKLDNIMMNYASITFVIGGSYGLSDDIKKRANYALSFSKLTFPHQLFRVILLEQLYRCFKIKNNENYHK